MPGAPWAKKPEKPEAPGKQCRTQARGAAAKTTKSLPKSGTGILPVRRASSPRAGFFRQALTCEIRLPEFLGRAAHFLSLLFIQPAQQRQDGAGVGNVGEGDGFVQHADGIDAVAEVF